MSVSSNDVLPNGEIETLSPSPSPPSSPLALALAFAFDPVFGQGVCCACKANRRRCLRRIKECWKAESVGVSLVAAAVCSVS